MWLVADQLRHLEPGHGLDKSVWATDNGASQNAVVDRHIAYSG